MDHPDQPVTSWDGVPFVFDADGTLCFDGVTIADDIVDELRACRRDHPLVFASARPIRDLLPVLPEDLHDCLLIGGNGAFVRGPEHDSVVGFTAEVRAELDRMIDDEDLTYLIDGKWDHSFTGDETLRIFRQLDPGRLAANVDRSDLETYSKAVLFTTSAAHIARAHELGLTLHEHPDEGHIDLSPRDVHKGSALLTALAGGSDAFVAFGNDANNVTMLRAATLAVCVGDNPAVTPLADRVVARSEVASAIASLSRRAR